LQREQQVLPPQEVVLALLSFPVWIRRRIGFPLCANPPSIEICARLTIINPT
jgi:hypothetical protein